MNQLHLNQLLDESIPWCFSCALALRSCAQSYLQNALAPLFKTADLGAIAFSEQVWFQLLGGHFKSKMSEAHCKVW